MSTRQRSPWGWRENGELALGAYSQGAAGIVPEISEEHSG